MSGMDSELKQKEETTRMERRRWDLPQLRTNAKDGNDRRD